MAKYCSDRPNRLHLLILAVYAQHLLRASLRRQVSQTPSFCTIHHVDCNAWFSTDVNVNVDTSTINHGRCRQTCPVSSQRNISQSCTALFLGSRSDNCHFHRPIGYHRYENNCTEHKLYYTDRAQLRLQARYERNCCAKNSKALLHTCYL
jgi:hypothetical protein